MLLAMPQAWCQGNNIPLGQWKLQTPYNNAKSLDIAGNKIYFACQVGMMVADRTDGSYTSFSRIEGLSSYNIDKLKYNTQLSTLLLAYSDGNIDLMKEGSVINVSDIKRKSIIGSKKINHIYFRHDSAFLSCDFGISLLDMKKNEIKESYENLGKGGVTNRIYASTIDGNADSIFIASDSGVMVATLSPFVNLQDYNNWYLFKTKDSLPFKTKVSSVCTLNNKVYAGIDKNGIYYFNGTHWVKTSIPIAATADILSMNVSENKMVICAGAGIGFASVITYDGSTFNVVTNPYIAYPSEAIFDPTGKLWIADMAYGSVNNVSGGFNYSYINGPGRITAVFRLYNYNNNIVALPGGFDEYFAPVVYDEGYYEYDNTTWKNYDIYSYPLLDIANTYVDAVYSPSNGSLYIASFRQGLLERKKDGTHVLYNNTSGFPGGCPISGSSPNIRISDLALDAQNNIWITSVVGSGSNSLSEIKTNGSCSGYSFADPGNFAMRIAIDDFGNKWIQPKYYGLMIYNEVSNKTRLLAQGAGIGNLPDNYVTAIEKDKKGQMWIGTKSGIAVFYDPSQIFNTSVDAAMPIYKHYPLLFGEHITCIEVDGGNRKWIGTQHGLWLFNEDGTQVIENFTTQNSPLLSDFIIDLEINKQTGEIFIGTDKGIISYRTDATEGTDEFVDVKVFPNPVTENFNGLVGISGLAANAVVKITDIYGNLMYETTAHGGTASWNLKNYNGTPAVTGVYLIYSTTSDGSLGFVSKIAVVR